MIRMRPVEAKGRRRNHTTGGRPLLPIFRNRFPARAAPQGFRARAGGIMLG
jgi:hypothetical protein